jgi:HEAT repeat protein
MQLLRCEDAWLRNAVLEALGQLPAQVGEVMEELLRDEDSDVRILALNMLTTLPHPKVPAWLFRMACEDEHPNVVAGALEGLCERGTVDMLPGLARLEQRFRGVPFLAFTVGVAMGRIKRQGP